jgi:predicted DNA-binding WGR domain protein
MIVPAVAVESDRRKEDIIMKAHLFCRAGGRSAEYQLELKSIAGAYVVAYAFGRIGSNLRSGLNKDTKFPVDWTTAAKAYNRTLAEKVNEGYVGDGQDGFADVEHIGRHAAHAA